MQYSLLIKKNDFEEAINGITHEVLQIDSHLNEWETLLNPEPQQTKIVKSLFFPNVVDKKKACTIMLK